MTFDFKLNSGLVVGLESDTLYMATEEDDEVIEVSCICVHLSFFTLMLIFD